MKVLVLDVPAVPEDVWEVRGGLVVEALCYKPKGSRPDEITELFFQFTSSFQQY
jgi:hypothetical protein